MAMTQLAFFIDINKCIFCHSCTYACNNENGPKDLKRRKILTVRQDHSEDTIHFSTSCNHCETPACMTVCNKNALKKLRNGIVVLDKKKCNGCAKCVAVCPFQAIKIDNKTNKADKCDMCYRRLQKGQQPICVEACIANAIYIDDITEKYPAEYRQTLKGYKMKTITNPSTRFKFEREEKLKLWINAGDEVDGSTNN